MVSGSFGISKFGAPLISRILPRFLHLRLEQNRSRTFQSVTDILAEETAGAWHGFDPLDWLSL